MESSKDNVKTTTVCVDTTVRDFIAAEADQLGLSQRQMIQRIVEAYDLARHQKGSESSTGDGVLQQVLDAVEKMLQRDERIIAFLKEQERILLNPILETAQSTDVRIKVLVELLKEFE